MKRSAGDGHMPLLTRLWTEATGTRPASDQSNFFDRGGDSLSAIRLAAAVFRHGLQFPLDAFLAQPTYGRLLALLSPLAGEDVVTEIAGNVPFTPAQARFLEWRLAVPREFSLETALEADGPINFGALRSAVRRLLWRHSALRLRLRNIGGEWSQQVTARPRALIRCYDDGDAGHEAVTGHLHKMLDPSKRPVVFAVLNGGKPRVVIAAHHLVCDGPSMHILATDLAYFYHKALAGERKEATYPLGFVAWAARLPEEARGCIAEGEMDWWLSRPWPADVGLNGRAAVCSRGELRRISELCEVDAQEFANASASVGLRPDQALATAVGAALAESAHATTGLLDMYGHGRDPSTSAMVGWLTVIHPVVLDFGNTQGSKAAAGRSFFMGLPRQGRGWGLLRYLHPDGLAASRLASLPIPTVLLNYRGKIMESMTGAVGNTAWGFGPSNPGVVSSPHNAEHYRFKVAADVVGGRLRITLHYAPRVDSPSCAADFVRQVLRNLMDVVREPNREGQGN